MVDVGIFRLIDPPPGQEEVIRAAIDAIDFPWERFDAALKKDNDHAIVVEWDDTGGQVSGTANEYGITIRLGTRAYMLDNGSGFVFTHEVGHLVDALTLRDEDRDAISKLYHDGEYTFIGHINHDHPDAGHVSEVWVDDHNGYLARLNECYADQFVAAFAPTVWDGSYLDGAPGHGPRFVHWTDDHEAIRNLTLWEAPPIEAEEDILSRGKAIDQMINDMTRWLNTHPKKTKKRATVLAARKLLRTIPKR